MDVTRVRAYSWGMRILLLNQFYAPDTAATGQLLGDVAGGLVARGHEVHVLASQRAYGGGAGALPAEETCAGVAIHRVAATGFGRAGLAGRGLDYLSFYALAAKKALALPRMDACVALTTPPLIALVGCLLQRRRGTKLIHWAMDLYPQLAVALGVLPAQGKLLGMVAGVAALSKKIYRRSDAIIALGERMAEVIAEAAPLADAKKISIVPNWVPGEAVTYREAVADGPARVLYSGNLGMGHELDTAVSAMAKLGSAASWQGRFVGQGKQRVALEAQVEAAGLTNVTFHPPVPLESLSENLAWGDIHLLSQRPGTEGLLVPSKLYGILAAGRASLYIGPVDTEVAVTIREVGCGLCCPAGDVEAVTAALRTLCGDPGLRAEMGLRARRAYREQFGQSRSVSAIVEVIESTMRTGS